MDKGRFGVMFILVELILLLILLIRLCFVSRLDEIFILVSLLVFLLIFLLFLDHFSVDLLFHSFLHTLH